MMEDPGMKSVAVTLLGCLVLACAKPWPDVKPIQTAPVAQKDSEWRVTDQVVVIADASGTMSREALLPEARAVAQSFIAGMPRADVPAKQAKTYEVSLIGFGGGDRITALHNQIDGLDSVPEGVVRHRDQLQWEAANLHPLPAAAGGGTTPLADVLGEASATLEGKRGQAAVLVISDGIADDPVASLEAGRALVAGYPDGVCIHTVHVGDNAEGRAHLGELAALSTDGCGSARDSEAVRDVAALDGLERDVFFGAAPLPPVSARPDPCGQRMVLRGVQFALDSAEIQSESSPILDVAADQLRECENLHVTVLGHTCSLGTDDYNQGLSERRAESVRQYLVAKGIAAERLAARGFGEGGPVASNDSEDGRSQNRRVELVPNP
jgi:outer membrane protein OmpA-like peptidoglycan-associated protein